MLLLLFLSFWLHVTVGQWALSKSDGPPSFLLQDPSDGLCLAGEKYKRCGLDTLWYVAGSYQMQIVRADTMQRTPMTSLDGLCA
jgi:hypothetical protein